MKKKGSNVYVSDPLPNGDYYELSLSGNHTHRVFKVDGTNRDVFEMRIYGDDDGKHLFTRECDYPWYGGYIDCKDKSLGLKGYIKRKDLESSSVTASPGTFTTAIVSGMALGGLTANQVVSEVEEEVIEDVVETEEEGLSKASSTEKPVRIEKSCSWKEGMFPRKVSKSKGCGSQTVSLCVGYIKCVKGDKEVERLATCGPENCKMDKATECARQGGYFSKAITKEDVVVENTIPEEVNATFTDQ